MKLSPFLVIIVALLACATPPAPAEGTPVEVSKLTLPGTEGGIGQSVDIHNTTAAVLQGDPRFLSGNLAIYSKIDASWTPEAVFSSGAAFGIWETLVAVRNAGSVDVRSRDTGGPGKWGIISSSPVPGFPGGLIGGASPTLAYWDRTIAVNIPGSDSSGDEVRIYRIEPGFTGSWTLIATLTSNSDDPHRFGRRLALEGNTLLVSEGGDSPSCYVFEEMASGWVRTAQFYPLGGEENFAGDIGLSGQDALIKNDAGPIAFAKVGGFWVRRGVLPTPDPEATWAGNFDISIDGDELVILELGGAQRALIYGKSAEHPSGWEFENAVDVGEPAEFGFAGMVAISGSQLMVGRTPHSADVRGPEIAGIYDLSGKLSGALGGAPIAGANFGRVFAIADDYLVVGDPEDSTHGEDAGSVSIYRHITDAHGGVEWDFVRTLTAPAPQAGAQFGAAVDLLYLPFPPFLGGGADFKIVVGAPQEDSQGAAYVFNLGTNFSPTQRIVSPGISANDGFGSAVAIGRASDDTPIAVGAPGEGTNGRVHMFEEQGGVTWSHVLELGPEGAGFQFFGDSVDISGRSLVVGAPNFNRNGTAYIFQRNPGENWTLTQTIEPTSGGSFFGKQVRFDDPDTPGTIPAHLLIGSGGLFAEPAHLYDANFDNGQFLFNQLLTPNLGVSPPSGFGSALDIESGRAAILGGGRFYVFDKHAGDWGLQFTGPALGLSSSVAVRGIHVIAGAPGDDSAAQDAGAIYAFRAGSYECWVEDQGSGFRKVSQPWEDPDCDRLTNLQEFALGSDPLSAASRSGYEVVLDPTDTTISFSAPHPPYNTQFLYHNYCQSEDLQGWSKRGYRVGVRSPSRGEAIEIGYNGFTARSFSRIELSYGTPK